MSLQDDLEEACYTVAGPFDTCAGALDWLENETPDLAVLDTLLKDGSCKALATEMARHRLRALVEPSAGQANPSRAPANDHAIAYASPRQRNRVAQPQRLETLDLSMGCQVSTLG